MLSVGARQVRQVAQYYSGDPRDCGPGRGAPVHQALRRQCPQPDAADGDAARQAEMSSPASRGSAVKEVAAEKVKVEVVQWQHIWHFLPDHHHHVDSMYFCVAPSLSFKD